MVPTPGASRIWKILGKGFRGATSPNLAEKIPIFSALPHPPLQSFPKLFFAETGKINKLQRKKCSFASGPHGHSLEESSGVERSRNGQA
ncbi:MAG TPA: hypothetical protein VKV96_00470 [Roseiarcus sp.]|nr:hypothetical protein [Roseiarcus sp.]